MKGTKGYSIPKMLWILRGRMEEGTDQILITKKEEGRYEFSTNPQRQTTKKSTSVV